MSGRAEYTYNVFAFYSCADNEWERDGCCNVLRRDVYDPDEIVQPSFTFAQGVKLGYNQHLDDRLAKVCVLS
jgi:hypothetical protein